MYCHVVAHTHWDREWYHPAERFRQRLVALVDELIDDPPRDGESFLLDGQTIVLDDYVAVRPDRAPELYQLLRDGRIEAGPWCVLADELIPSGEALVRNLLAGRRTLRRIGVDAPPVLYCPDSFGHPAALPSIAQGFGLSLIILWRGYGGARWPHGDVVRWLAPAGDAALIYHLPRDGYEFGSHLPVDAPNAAARWRRMRDELAPRSTTGVELIPNGADHHARQLHQREAVAALAAAAPPDTVHASSLRAFSASVLGAAAKIAEPVPSVRGELRDSYGYTWTLQGTFATRAHEKRMNARAERLLLREAEPWAALAARASRTRTSRRPLVEASWRTLLEAHPHDTLCGCSIDEVADAMELRIRSATNQAAGIRDDSILDLIEHDRTDAREARDRWMPVVLVRNAAARPRGGVAIVDAERFIADVPVGPGSGAQPIVDSRAEWPTPESLGTTQDLHVHWTAHELTESPRHYPDNDLVETGRLAIWVPPVPAYGIATAASHATTPFQEVSILDGAVENGRYRLSVEGGTIALEDLSSGRRVSPLIDLVDDADVGDAYTPAPRPVARFITAEGSIGLERGPLIGSVNVAYLVREAPERNPAIRVNVTLSVFAESPCVRISVSGSNHLHDHRLRLRVHSDVKAGDVWADAAFGPVMRKPIVVPPADAAMEFPPRTAPLHRYVSRFNGDVGCTVFGDGLAEYEADDDGSIFITLVRSVDALSRRDLLERPGHAGWPKAIPAAQCIGPIEASFGVMLHGARTAETIDAIERSADDVLLPLTGTTLRSALRVPSPVQGVELKGIGLACSTIKDSEDGGWLVLRCVNLLEQTAVGSWTVPFDVTECARARLDETPLQPLTCAGGVIAFDAEPRAIVTILVR